MSQQQILYSSFAWCSEPILPILHQVCEHPAQVSTEALCPYPQPKQTVKSVSRVPWEGRCAVSQRSPALALGHGQKEIFVEDPGVG